LVEEKKTELKLMKDPNPRGPRFGTLVVHLGNLGRRRRGSEETFQKSGQGATGDHQKKRGRKVR